jgi:hypothetical protein
VFAGEELRADDVIFFPIVELRLGIFEVLQVLQKVGAQRGAWRRVESCNVIDPPLAASKHKHIPHCAQAATIVRRERGLKESEGRCELSVPRRGEPNRLLRDPDSIHFLAITDQVAIPGNGHLADLVGRVVVIVNERSQRGRQVVGIGVKVLPLVTIVGENRVHECLGGFGVLGVASSRELR